ncbi:MAG: GTPase ObgE, partial [Halobacteriovoraceae bacterium]|nr:GTPase ObgE [Halobacteriovoraceae bacterium]
KKYVAESGGPGGGNGKTGKNGKNLVISVPVGTLIKNIQNNHFLTDLSQNKQRVMIAQGGRGGLGNSHFKTATNQAPRYHQKGEEGVSLDLELELKLLADIALVGLPNAGKSTLISRLSAARPKVADYPFTTLTPTLGVVQMEEKSLVLADIPGLIENASKGKGLGIKFLKHIERTKAIVHLVDCSMCLEGFEAFENYCLVRNELLKYKQSFADKREIICFTKTDAMTDREISNFQSFFGKNLSQKALPISSVSGKNLDILKILMFEALTEQKEIKQEDAHMELSANS